MAAILLSLALALSPALFWFQQVKPEVFTQRLFLPHLAPVIDRHTPHYTNGTYLPPTITKNQTLPTSASPVILTGTTRVAPGTTLTIAAGTTIYAAEFATLTIDGTLITQGTAAKPVIFSTNEQHEANQLWNGLVFGAGSHGDLRHTTIEYATPAVTCLKNSSVTGDHVHPKNTKRPAFSITDRCL
jgi:hypothetical protein